MKTKALKSFSDLSAIKDTLATSKKQPSSEAQSQHVQSSTTTSSYKHLNESDRSKWAAVFDLLEDKFFSDLTAGLENKISSKKYSTVTAVLSYPTEADHIISQQDLNRAHGLAYFIKASVNSGSIKYTNARVPSTWRISGNPGTKR